MIDHARSPDPDIPAKELFLSVAKIYIPIPKLEKFRSDADPKDQGKDLVEFVGSEYFRTHIAKMQEMERKPGMLPELAHEAVLAEERRAKKLAAQADETQDAVAAVLVEATA